MHLQQSLRLHFAALILILFTLSSLTIANPAGALDYVSSRSITLTADGVSSTLEVDFGQPIKKEEADRQLAQYAGGELVASGLAVQSSKGKRSLYCNKPIAVSDFNGIFTAQRKCNGRTVPWGYRLSTKLKSYITSSVLETGMRSRVNGGKLKKASAHRVNKHYQFHGTWYAKKDSSISYYDFFHFNLGRNKGKLTIRGTLDLK